MISYVNLKYNSRYLCAYRNRVHLNKLGYNDHSYNKFTATRKKNNPFICPKYPLNKMLHGSSESGL